MVNSQIIHSIRALDQFIGPEQLQAIGDGLRGPERGYFQEKLAELAERVQIMPQTYDQDGLGDAATVYLHYFKGGSDWYILEKDSDPDGSGQWQAFGFVILNGWLDEAELGYIPIPELLACHVELDLHWTPKPLDTVKMERGLIREAS